MMTSFLVKERTKETYLQKISSEPQGTQQNRIVTINNFERFVGELYEEKTIESVIEELKILKKTEEERYLDALYDLLQEWINWNTEQEIESSTQRTFFSYLRNYLYYRGIKTNQQDIKENLKFGKKIHVERHPLSQEEYRMIIDAIRNPKRKALFLLLGSSGMRIGEAMQLKKKDLDVSQERIKVNIPAEITKTRKGRSTYMSRETEKMLKPFLDDYADDDFIFDFGSTTDKSMRSARESNNLRTVLKRLNLDDRYPSNNHGKITTHSFRAYFFTLATRRHGENYAHRLTGHSGYLMQYDRMTEEEKLDMYIELEQDLMIYDQTKNELEIEKLQKDNKELTQLRQELRELKKQRDENYK